MSSNAGEVAARLTGLQLTRDEAKLALQAGALAIEQEAKKRAPYKSGSLRRDIGTETRDDGGVVRVLIGNSKAIPYAPFQEFGTSRGVPAKAYLRGALREKRKEAVEQVAKAAKHIMRGKAKS